MAGLFEQFRQKVLSATVRSEDGVSDNSTKTSDTVDNFIALGVLLWEVAQADAKFLPEEKGKMQEVLRSYGKISDQDIPIVLRAIKEASINSIDLYSFTREVSSNLSFEGKIGILEQLFRVACIDHDLDHEEHEVIRKISGLLQVDHKDFIEAKIKIKKEFGLDTAGL